MNELPRHKEANDTEPVTTRAESEQSGLCDDEEVKPVLCEKCNERQATIHLKQIWGNENIEMHLCSVCAAAHSPDISFNNFFLGVVNSFFKDIDKSPEEFVKLDVYKCDSCGLTYDDFRKHGRLGCSDCYNAFRNELSAIFSNVQGSTEHRGKLPQKAESSILSERRLSVLKSELSKAVEREEYESAAKIRDEIKALKAGESNGKMV